jgi:Uma2 family endonuclease
MVAVKEHSYTPEEYLALEERAEFKSEYIDGQIVPMTGGSTNHNRISGNLYAALNFALRQQDYEVFIADVRLWIPKKRIYTYPDVMVIAEEPVYFENRTDTVMNPQVLIEVLSKSTGEYDRTDKFTAYRTMPSFQEYLLIDQAEIHVDQYVRTGPKRWSITEYNEEDEKVKFATLGFEIALEDLYNKVRFEVDGSEGE